MTTAPAYVDWIDQRSVPYLGTNDGAQPIAFQSWHRFKEAFPPELIAQAIRSSEIEVEACIDPFGGSGTTALTCQMLGVASDTLEINPFLADVIRAKTHRYHPDELIHDLATVRRNLRGPSVDPQEYFAHTPPSFIQRPDLDRWIFDLDTAERLATLLTAVDKVSDLANRRLFAVLVGGLLADVSNVIVSGKGRRYRRGWEAASRSGMRVDRLFADRAGTAIEEIQRFAHRPNPRTEVHLADARQLEMSELYGLSVFSPPYPNSFDYTDVYNLELWMLGYLRERTQNRTLRQQTLSSHVQVSREYAPLPTGSAALSAVVDDLNDIRSTLWSQRLPEMIGGYFADTMEVISRVRRSLEPGAQCWIVIGDSQYAGILVPASLIVQQLANSEGWDIVSTTPIRHMKSSPQQGWTPRLAESLLVLRN